MKILVIGGGAAGMMAAIAAADAGASVVLAEKNEKLGKKLFITGKGRCNVTNRCDTEEFFAYVLSNPRFLYSAVYAFPPSQMWEFLEGEGLPLKEERGRRVFPVSDKSSDVIRTLQRSLERRGVSVMLHTAVKDLLIRNDRCEGVLLESGRRIMADAVIIATGGLSYPSTGDTGDGYRFAQKYGHRMTDPLPSLVPLKVREQDAGFLEGLSLRNVGIRMKNYRDQGEMLFTSDGVSGPLILSASAYLCKALGREGESLELSIDLKPALTEQQLDSRILRDFEAARNRDFCNALSGLLPSKLIPVIIARSQIPEHKKVHDITREERKKLVTLLKDLTFTVTGTKGFEQAVITQGGVCVKDVSPSTMGSKKVKGLYFAGEVLDVDAYTGGFNLQIAWSTGYLAGFSAAEGQE